MNRPTLKIAEPIDPKLESIIENLFEGSQANSFGDLVKKYARFKLDHEGAWVSGEIFMLEFQQMLEYARESVEDETPARDFVDENGTERDSWEHGG